MNIHEFQAKNLFAIYDIPVPRGSPAQRKEDFEPALIKMPEGKVVVKAQIHAGGRGKGIFADGFAGGVKIASDHEEAKRFAARMLGNTLVTKQTGPAGRKVQTVYFDEPIAIRKEYYLAMLLDRATSCATFIASTEGGMDIEEVAASTPEKITRVAIDPGLGWQGFHGRRLASGLGLTGELFGQMVRLSANLYKLFMEKDAALVEINPLIVTGDGRLMALDAKISFDDNAMFRHPEIMAWRDMNEEDPKETAASDNGLSYIALDGNIACLVNGAGLAMATMDIIKYYGGQPANFLDVGGGASAEQVTQAFRIILSDDRVQGILVNIFGGIMSCQTIAAGIIEAARNVEIDVPLVVRLEGNNVEEGKRMLADSGLPIVSGDSLADAAQKIAKLAGAKA